VLICTTAVQQEFLGQSGEALTSYEKATKVVTTHLGPRHPLVGSLSDSLNAARQKVKDKEKRRQKEGGGAQGKEKKPRMTHSASAVLSDGEYNDNDVSQSGFSSD
jgi:hypothetical protein